MGLQTWSDSAQSLLYLHTCKTTCKGIWPPPSQQNCLLSDPNLCFLSARLALANSTASQEGWRAEGTQGTPSVMLAWRAHILANKRSHLFQLCCRGWKSQTQLSSLAKSLMRWDNTGRSLVPVSQVLIPCLAVCSSMTHLWCSASN